jgi:DNA replication protein DnaC
MENVISRLNALKLHVFSDNLEQVINRHPESREAIINALTELATAELTHKQQKTIAYRIDQAKFGQIQTIDTYDFSYNASTLKIKNRYLKLFTAELMAQSLSVLIVGTSGLGKTHLARALGYFFCQECLRVRFTTLDAMCVDLKTADETGSLKKTMLAYTQPTLLILDEIGFASLRELESNLVFQIISQRYEHKRSTVITTNRPFGEWNQIFHNDAMAHALLDRLIERSEVFHLEGKSYRETHRKKLTS